MVWCLIDGFYIWGGACSGVPMCTASPDGWLIGCPGLIDGFEAGREAVCPRVQPLLMVDWLPRVDWWILYLRRGVKRCAHVYSLSWWLGWLVAKVWLMDFIVKAGREALCPRVQPLLMVDWWLPICQGLTDAFWFEAGREAVCPRVQPLLMVGWLITKGLIDGFYIWAERKAVCPRVHPLLMVDWWLPICQGLTDAFWFEQCCGTVTIYYGSDFWKVMVLVSVPVPTFEKLWFRFRFLLLKKFRFRFRFRFQLHI